MKKLILSLLLLVSVSVNGQPLSVSEPYMVEDVVGTYYDSNHVLRYVEQLPEYVSFGYWVNQEHRTPKKLVSFTIYNKSFLIGSVESVTSSTESLTLGLKDSSKKVVGSIKIEEPYPYYSGEVTFTLNVVIDGMEHNFKGKLDHSVIF